MFAYDWDITAVFVAVEILLVVGIAFLVRAELRARRVKLVTQTGPGMLQLFGLLDRKGCGVVDESDLDHAVNSYLTKLNDEQRQIVRDFLPYLQEVGSIVSERVWINGFGVRFREPIYGITQAQLSALSHAEKKA